MAIPNVYCVHHRGTGTQQVYQLINGTSLVQIGNDLADGLEVGVGTTSANVFDNQVIEFKGKRYIWHKQFIKEENSDGAGGTSVGNWGIVHTTTTPTSFFVKSGLFTLLRNGELNMVGLYDSGGTRAFRFDGTTFTDIFESSPGAVATGTAIVFNNKLYWSVAGATKEYDPVTDDITHHAIPGVSFGTIARDFSIINGNLFICGYTNYSGGDQFAKLHMLTANGWSLKHTFTGLTNDFQGANQNPVLFSPDNSSLVFIMSGEDMPAGTPGDQAYLIQNPGTGSQVVTNITDPVIPPEFRNGGSQAVGTAHYYLFADTQNSSSPTSPDFYMWRRQHHDSGNHAFYQWQGTGAELSFIGNGPSYQYSFPHVRRGGQDRISGGASATTGKIYAELENPVLSSSMGSMDISFRVYGSDTGLDGRVYLSLGQELPDTQITITSVTGGSATVMSNVISNITADNGSTLYTFTWAASTDGVVDGEHVTLVMDLTT